MPVRRSDGCWDVGEKYSRSVVVGAVRNVRDSVALRPDGVLSGVGNTATAAGRGKETTSICARKAGLVFVCGTAPPSATGWGMISPARVVLTVEAWTIVARDGGVSGDDSGDGDIFIYTILRVQLGTAQYLS